MCLAIPGELLSIAEGDDPFERSGRVSFGGIVKWINLALVPEARQGDYVLAHVGIAIGLIDELEAGRILDELDALEIDASGEERA